MEIITNKQDGILTIAFNRPEKKNSITSAMYQLLVDAVREGESDKSIRVLLFAVRRKSLRQATISKTS